MIKHKIFVFLILFGVGICSSQLSGQNFPPPGAQLTSPFSPGGFDTIGNASASGYGSVIDGNGLPITFEVDGGAALIIDIWSSGGARTNIADGMRAPTSSLASLEWRPRRPSVFCSPSAEHSSPNRQRCCLQVCFGKRQRCLNHGEPSIWA